MKNQLITSVVCLFLTFSAFAQKAENKSLQCKNVEDFSTNAFLLTRYPKKNATTVEASYIMQEGDFFSPLASGKYKGGQFKTSSFLSLNKWQLHGIFHYQNTFSDKSKFKLSAFTEQENPLFLIQKKDSPSQTISYKFNTFAARKIIDDKTYLGMKLYYKGGSFYKKSDLRNTQNLLSITSGVGIGRKFNSNITAGVDFALKWKKTKPSISSVYQHGVDEAQYKHYMNVGFGTLVKNPGFSFDVKTISPSLILFLTKEKSNIQQTFHSTLAFSSCVWKDLLVKDANLFNKPYKYEDKHIGIRYALKLKNRPTEWGHSLAIAYTKGESFWQEENRDSYSQASWNKKFALGYSISIEKQNSILQHLEINTIFTHKSTRDKNYSTKVTYATLAPQVKAGFSFSPQSPNSSKLNLSAQYTQTLTENISIKALFSNNFMSLVGNQLIDYWTADKIDLNATFSYPISRKKNTRLFTSAHYLKPLNTKEQYEKKQLYAFQIGIQFNY